MVDLISTSLPDITSTDAIQRRPYITGTCTRTRRRHFISEEHIFPVINWRMANRIAHTSLFVALPHLRCLKPHNQKPQFENLFLLISCADPLIWSLSRILLQLYDVSAHAKFEIRYLYRGQINSSTRIECRTCRGTICMLPAFPWTAASAESNWMWRSSKWSCAWRIRPECL